MRSHDRSADQASAAGGPTADPAGRAPAELLLREAIAALAESARAAIAEAARGGAPQPPAAALERLAASAAREGAEEILLAARSMPRALPPAARIEAAGGGLADARALAACAAEVIQAVPRATETATFAIIERFEAVRSLTSEAASAARAARGLFSGEASGSSVLSTAKSSREAVVSERLAVAEIAARNKASAKALRGICKAIDDGIELIRGIEDITERSRLIAFNLAVEAAHFGDKGRGFKIIASELRSLNDRTEEFSGKVTGLLERLGSESADLVRETAEETDRMVSEAEKGMEATERAVESLIGASEETERFAREIAALSERIDADMNGVLESLQFQDITRQIVEGAAAMLGELPPILEEARRALPPRTRDSAPDASRFEAVRSRLLAAAKTRDEKEALARARL